MPITVTPTYRGMRQQKSGEDYRMARLVIAGLTAAAANTIPHGLPAAPVIVVYEATSGTPGFETSDADGTNLYFSTGAGQTSLKAYAWY